MNYARLVSLYEQRSPEEANTLLREAHRAREIRLNHVDLGRLFCECFGWNEFVACRNKEQLACDVFSRALTEAQGAVSSNAFLNVAGQIVYSTILDAYEEFANVFTQLIPEVQTAFLDGEKIAGLTQIGDEAQIRPEADPYALAGFGEDWVFTPPLKDRGFIVPVTWEAIFQDRTGQITQRATDVGKWMGINREKRAIDCVIDENTTTHRYNWRGVTIATYGDNSGSHSWDNLAASNTILDWTSVNTALQIYNGILDPYTGEPVMFEPKHLIVAKQNEMTALRIMNATEIRVSTPGYATTGNPTQTNLANPYSNRFTVVTSPLLATRLATDTDWFVGDVTQYARYMQAEKLTVLQAPPNNHDEFHRRIVLQTRANERGAYTVIQPRAMMKSTVA